MMTVLEMEIFKLPLIYVNSKKQCKKGKGKGDVFKITTDLSSPQKKKKKILPS